MKLLAIECAGSSCSMALSLDGVVTQELELMATRQQSQLLLPMQDSLLKQAGLELRDLDLLVCGHGPGSFTGVRVAVAVTQGLAFGADLPVLGLSSLAALAYGAAQASQANKVLVALDARMNELYWGGYGFSQIMEILLPDSLGTAEDLARHELTDYLLVGNGWRTFAGTLQELPCAGRLEDYPQQAADLAGLASVLLEAGLAETGPAGSLQPVYLRNQVTDQSRR